MQIQENIEFMCPVKFGSGAKALEHLPMDLASLDARKPLIVTSKEIQASGLIKNIEKAFRTSGLVLGVYDAVDDASAIDTIKKLTEIYLDKGFDSIMAVGGGKIADIAKVLNIVVSGKPEDLKTATGVDNVNGPLRPLVYIPTSFGTGNEASSEATVNGMSFSSRYLMPDIIVIDPRMLKEERLDIVVNQAMAALTRSLEVYADPAGGPLAAVYADVSISLIMENLGGVIKRALEEKGWFGKLTSEIKDRKGRIALANAYVTGDSVFSNVKPGLAQLAGVEISKRCDIKPGIAMGIMLPYVLEYNAHRKGHDSEKIMLPIAGLDIYCSTPAGQRFDSAIGKIRHLQNELFSVTSGMVPRTLQDAGLNEDSLNSIAEKIAGGGYDTDACLMILEHAYEGKPVIP
jgi:alcohol dehydrogenase